MEKVYENKVELWSESCNFTCKNLSFFRKKVEFIFKKKKTQENLKHFFFCFLFLLPNLENSRFKINIVLNVTHLDLYLPQTCLLLGKKMC